VLNLIKLFKLRDLFFKQNRKVKRDELKGERRAFNGTGAYFN
jgi:hypothetical protein